MFNKELAISLMKYGSDADGNLGYWKVGFDFSLFHFGGVLPKEGDTIVAPIGGRDPTKYPLFVVEKRFFRPAKDENHWPAAALIVSERTGTKQESHVIVGGG